MVGGALFLVKGLALKVSDLNLFTLTIILVNFVFLTSPNETLRFV